MADQIIERRRGECSQKAEIETLKARDGDMQKTLDAVSTKLDLILVQITKVAVLEEKHSNQTADVNRAHLYIANLEAKHDSDDKEVRAALDILSKETLAFINQAKGQNRVIWALFGAGGSALLTLLIKILFFMGAHGVGG